MKCKETYNSVPLGSNSHPVAQGTANKTIIAVGAGGAAQTTSGAEWKEFFMPDDESCNSANIRVGDPRPSYADPESNYENFLWCHVDPITNPNVAIAAFNSMGQSPGIAVKGGESLGFFKSVTEGQSVILWARE